MGGERVNKSLFLIAMEAGLFPANMTRKLGGYAFTKAVEIYTGRPSDGEPHIADRLQADEPVTEAKIGQQFVEIGHLIDPSAADSSQRERELAERRDGYIGYGQRKIVKALRAVDDSETYGHDRAQQVINIAKEMGTDPTRIREMPELEQQRISRIIEP